MTTCINGARSYLPAIGSVLLDQLTWFQASGAALNHGIKSDCKHFLNKGLNRRLLPSRIGFDVQEKERKSLILTILLAAKRLLNMFKP